MICLPKDVSVLSPLTPILLRSHTHQLLEVFAKGRLVREVELIGDFLDAEIGILEHDLGFQDNEVVYPFGGCLARVVFYHAR